MIVVGGFICTFERCYPMPPGTPWPQPKIVGPKAKP
jgi:hypothetical protein